jgi:hypothetical protein
MLKKAESDDDDDILLMFCFFDDVVLGCGMNLLKPTCYLFLNDGEVHKWIGGVKKKDGKNIMAGSPSFCMCVRVCLKEREMGGGALEKSTKVEPV